MSPHAGTYCLDSSPNGTAGEGILPWLSALLGARDPDECVGYAHGPFAVVCRAPQPPSLIRDRLAVSPTRAMVLWDGRLDNRVCLGAQLRDSLGDGRCSSPDIVLAAYSKWGRDALARLVGDFAFVLWGPDERTVLLARVFTGVRPLYYRVCDGQVLWSSELEAFLRAGEHGSALAIDDEYARAFLTANPDAERTPYSGVIAVPPGKGVVIRFGRVFHCAGWQPDAGATIHFSRDTEYQEQFFLIFRQAVEDRLRVAGGVWSELSGGLDSSSIVCMADDILRRQSGYADFNTISYLSEPMSPGDEIVYMDAVADRIGNRGYRLSERDYPAFFPADPVPFLSRPVSVVGRHLRVAQALEEHGAKILLSGHGGDAIMWSTTRICPYFADLLAEFRLGSLHKALAAYSTYGARSYWNLLWHDAIGPLISGLRRPRLAPWICMPHSMPAPASPTDTTLPRGNRPSQQAAYALLRDAINVCCLHRVRTCGPADASYPFLDRRLVQFMLAVPFDQKFRPGATRWLHRAALAGVLPEAIRTRKSKASGQGFACRSINREWAQLRALFGDEPRATLRGYVRASPLNEALERARRGLAVDSLALIRTIAIETWLRNVETGAPRVVRNTASDSVWARLGPRVLIGKGWENSGEATAGPQRTWRYVE